MVMGRARVCSRGLTSIISHGVACSCRVRARQWWFHSNTMRAVSWVLYCTCCSRHNRPLARDAVIAQVYVAFVRKSGGRIIWRDCLLQFFSRRPASPLLRAVRSSLRHNVYKASPDHPSHGRPALRRRAGALQYLYFPRSRRVARLKESKRARLGLCWRFPPSPSRLYHEDDAEAPALRAGSWKKIASRRGGGVTGVIVAARRLRLGDRRPVTPGKATCGWRRSDDPVCRNNERQVEGRAARSTAPEWQAVSSRTLRPGAPHRTLAYCCGWKARILVVQDGGEDRGL